jgi:Uma2 family endonuclease
MGSFSLPGAMRSRFGASMSFVKPKRWLWSRSEYYKLAEQGMFEEQRVELIEGEIIAMPAQKSAHVMAVELTKKAIETALGPKYWVRMQAPLHLRRRSAPEPDIAVIAGATRDHEGEDNPSTALLIVEVSDSTLAYDRGRKASLYASAGIADYWILNLATRRLEVRRRAIADAGQKYQHAYSDLSIFGEVDNVALLAVPSAMVRVADMLPKSVHGA